MPAQGCCSSLLHPGQLPTHPGHCCQRLTHLAPVTEAAKEGAEEGEDEECNLAPVYKAHRLFPSNSGFATIIE